MPIAIQQSVFNPLDLPTHALRVEFLELRRSTFRPTIDARFVAENLGDSEQVTATLSAWTRQLRLDGDFASKVLEAAQTSSTLALQKILPPYFRDSIHSWASGPYADCVSTAMLALFPELDRTELILGPQFAALEEYLRHVVSRRILAPAAAARFRQTSLGWLHHNPPVNPALPEGAHIPSALLHVANAITTGTILEIGERGSYRPNLHVVTVLGTLEDGPQALQNSRVSERNILVIEKEETGIYPVRIDLLSNVARRVQRRGRPLVFIAYRAGEGEIPPDWIRRAQQAAQTLE